MKERKTKITFVVPGRGTYPVGGFRIVYEYANRLSVLEFDVTIVHIAWLYKSHSFLIGFGRYFYCLAFYRFYKKWFILNPKIHNKWVFVPKEQFIPDAEFIVATSWETAENVVEFSGKKGKKIYLIQGDESEFSLAKKNNWQQRVQNTWNFPMQKIVISSWLEDRIKIAGHSTAKIFNGLNFNDFYIKNPLKYRDVASVIMLYHDSEAKGCTEGLAALRIMKKAITNLKVTLFGVPNKPTGLEDWIEYYKMPSREELNILYNRSAIFLSPSHSEGWGLPVAEAMQCGCAVVVSNIGGFKDFVEDNYTGLCFNVKCVDDIVTKLSLLIKNDELRLKIAENGNLFVKKFQWDKAVTSMSDLFNLLKK